MTLEGELQIQRGSWKKLAALAAEVRLAVFVQEQGIPETEEWDDQDAVYGHWVALLDGEAIGCARMSAEGKIGRMAVLQPYRGQGVGRQLLQACVTYAQQKGFKQVRLSAQTHALSFYEKQGFEPDGPPHEEVGIPHQWMRRELDTSPAGAPLLDYLVQVKALVEQFPAAWITATLSEVRRPSTGHVYVTLVQTAEDGEPVAKCRALIWRSTAEALESRFVQATGMRLANNQDVMVKVQAQSHPLHGFSLVIEDIHPEFTVGQLAAKLDKIRRQLRSEGLFDRNRQLGLPDDYFRVAVLSPQDAAGLGDFRSRADQLMALGVLQFVYFTALFQGPKTAVAIADALARIESEHAQQPFDAVVIIRGGGSEWDLACLNELDIARAVCRMSMPVICGIGHERDSTIIDEIACHRLPTPSMVIDFIEAVVMSRLQRVVVNMRDICRLALGQTRRAHERLAHLQGQVMDLSRQQVRQADDRIEQAKRRLGDLARQQVDRVEALLQSQVQRLTDQARRDVEWAGMQVDRIRFQDLPQAVHQRLERVGMQLESLAESVRLQDPARILQRGYAMLLDEKGQPVTSVVSARQQQGELHLRLRDGELPITVRPLDESQQPEQDPGP